MGGIQRVTIVKANALAEVPGNEVAICYTDKGHYPKTIHPLSPKVAIFDLGTPYWQFASLKKVLSSFLPTVLATRKALKNLIQRYKPNIVISTGTYEKFALASLSLSERLFSKNGGGIHCMSGNFILVPLIEDSLVVHCAARYMLI